MTWQLHLVVFSSFSHLKNVHIWKLVSTDRVGLSGIIIFGPGIYIHQKNNNDELDEPRKYIPNAHRTLTVTVATEQNSFFLVQLTDALGEVVFVQLPDVGKELVAGDESGALESVKAASEVYTPVSGTVSEKNTAVESTPSLINKSCYQEGWLFKVKLSNPKELQNLMDQSAYDSYLKESH